MIGRLTARSFTVFGDSTFEFAQGLNVLVGDNGSGKSHALKLAYSLLSASVRPMTHPRDEGPTRRWLSDAVTRKLTGVFRPERLGRLTRRDRPGRTRASVEAKIARAGSFAFEFNTASKSVEVTKPLKGWAKRRPVFLPTRELLSVYPGFVPLYESTHLEFDETWRDTCLLLGKPSVRGPREETARRLLAPLEEAMGGRVDLDNGRFYVTSGGTKTEMHLVAEGLRKLAMLARLIATGSLLDKGALFWDEPESNLNPRVLREVARVIFTLADRGVQVFVATHSLFLIRELDILGASEFEDVGRAYFGLRRGGGPVEVVRGESVDGIGDFESLDQELMQSDRYLAADP